MTSALSAREMPCAGDVSRAGAAAGNQDDDESLLARRLIAADFFRQGQDLPARSRRSFIRNGVPSLGETYRRAVDPGNCLCHDESVIDPVAEDAFQPRGEDRRGFAHAGDDYMPIVGKFHTGRSRRRAGR